MTKSPELPSDLNESGIFEHVATHRGHDIRRRRPGFEFTPILLGKISAYLVSAPAAEEPGVFAFMYRLAELRRPILDVDEDRLAERALKTIAASIDSGDAIGGRERTLELQGDDWVEVTRPPWWVPVLG